MSQRALCLHEKHSRAELVQLQERIKEQNEGTGKHSQNPVEDLEEGEDLLQCQQWFLKAVAATKLENIDE